jgi:hypothetical protein
VKTIDVLPVFNFLEFAVHHFIYVGQLGLARRTYNDDDNAFNQTIILLQYAVSFHRGSWQKMFTNQ